MIQPHIIAQALPPGFDWPSMLASAGVAGVVLAWFMFRTETRLKLIENSIDRMARAHLLSILSTPNVNTNAKEAATGIIKEIDDSKAREGGK